jgi:hypothetical protein
VKFGWRSTSEEEQAGFTPPDKLRWRRAVEDRRTAMQALSYDVEESGGYHTGLEEWLPSA